MQYTQTLNCAGKNYKSYYKKNQTKNQQVQLLSLNLNMNKNPAYYLKK